ncbi:MAG: GNAT family N-acetyltransferase [Dongiaceae bacterium]
MIIRAAAKGDAKALSDLATATYQEAFGLSLSAGDLAAYLSANLSEACFETFMDEDVNLIAEMDDRVVGYVQFGAVSVPVETVSADREVRRLYVHPEFQGRGVGKRLLDAALEHPQLKTAGSIYLDVWERNHGALRLYRRYGFEVIGAHRFEVQSGAPTDLDLIMLRRS